MILRRLTKFSTEYISFFAETFPALAKTAARLHGFGEAGPECLLGGSTEAVVTEACGCVVWALETQRLSTVLGGLVTTCVSLSVSVFTGVTQQPFYRVLVRTERDDA